MHKTEDQPKAEVDDEVRMRLPVEKDPDMKFSIWSVIKDSIGKELYRITVPVFFNEPLSIL